MSKPLTYGSYLRLPELLALQSPASQEHDELLFISIHQVYELWFKQLLHEGEDLRNAMLSGQTDRVLARFKRMLTIFKTLVGQVDVLETMTPLEFNAFRARLEASSGFQSAQFRALEIFCGARAPQRLAHYPPESPEHQLLVAATQAPSLYQCLLHYLHQQGFTALPLVASAATEGPQSEPAHHAALIAVYQQGGLPAQVCERMVDLDEALQEWRYRHVKMVERTIGHKPGTGGSPGAEYLRRTLFTPMFPDLWAIRAAL